MSVNLEKNRIEIFDAWIWYKKDISKEREREREREIDHVEMVKIENDNDY